MQCVISHLWKSGLLIVDYTCSRKHLEVRRVEPLRLGPRLVFTVALNLGFGRDDWAEDL